MFGLYHCGGHIGLPNYTIPINNFELTCEREDILVLEIFDFKFFDTHTKGKYLDLAKKLAMYPTEACRMGAEMLGSFALVHKVDKNFSARTCCNGKGFIFSFVTLLIVI